MTIHYHGTPITPRHVLQTLTGRHFCVSFAARHDGDECMRVGQSVMWDNGAFSVFTRGAVLDETKLHAWLEPRLYPPHWAVALDVIGGDEAAQRALLKSWPWPRELSAPVWHVSLSLDYLRELLDEWPRVCFGSTAEYWQVGSERWARRIDQAFDVIEAGNWRPWIHMLRGSAQCGRWPFASVDSTNIARNHHLQRNDAVIMANIIDAQQCPVRREATQPELALECA